MMMNLRVYAISFYLLISCLTSVNGQVYIGLIKQSGTNNCIAVPEGKAVAGQDLTTTDCGSASVSVAQWKLETGVAAPITLANDDMNTVNRLVIFTGTRRGQPTALGLGIDGGAEDFILNGGLSGSSLINSTDGNCLNVPGDGTVNEVDCSQSTLFEFPSIA